MAIIYITGEINTEAFQLIGKRLRKIRITDPSEELIIVLNSEGGNAYDAYAIYDLLRLNKEYGITIDVVATGLVASAATLILAAGSKRKMTQNAWVMVHEDTTVASKKDKVSEVERVAKHARRLEDQWNALLAKHTKLTASEWTELNKTDLYLTPQDCLKYGLIDEII